jgi:hypothetical protein
MEPLSTLAATAVTVLVPYLAKGAEEFVKAAGKDAYEKARNLVASLRARWAGNSEALETLTRVAEKPGRYEPVLRDILEEELKDPSFAAELSRQLDALGPHLRVIQELDEAKNVTGIEVEEFTRGNAQVEQKIKKGESVTSAKIKKLG